MMKIKKIAIPLIVLMTVYHLFAAESYRFAAGFKGGTYLEITEAIQQATGLDFTIQKSSGSVENIRLLKNDKADFALAQLDILTNNFRYKKDIKESVKILMPLYAEELHVLTLPQIKSLKDLTGKKVAVGPIMSGTRGTASIVLGTYGLDETKVSTKSDKINAALMKLQKKEIDAMFLVSGAPVKILKSLPANANIHLLSFSGSNYKLLTDGFFPYQKSILKKSDYPWLKKDISTLKINSAIIVSSKTSDAVVKKVLGKIIAKLQTLKTKHKKLNNIDFNFIRKYRSEHAEYFHKAALPLINKL